MNLFNVRTCLASVLLSGSFLTAYALPLSAQEALSSYLSPKQKQNIRYTPPQTVGTPRTTTGGVVRGNCNGVLCLIALQPGSRFKLDHLPLTVSPKPTFFFNIPTTNNQGYFKLYQAGDTYYSEQLIYKTTFSLNSAGGIIRFRLPDDAPPLKVDQTYRWEFSIGTAANYETVKSFLKRVTLPPTLASQLKQSQPLERASLYAKAGMWFEMLETLADLRTSQPDNSEVLLEWVELLKSVQLDKVAEQPLVECCKTSN